MIRLLMACLLLIAPPALAQELRGHGGPVRALAVSGDGRIAVSGSFDTSAILWNLETGSALAVLRAHDGAVNAVAALPGGRFATAGEEGRIAIWRPGQGQPERVIAGHGASVAGLAVSPDGRLLASASWDGTVRVTPLGGGEAEVIAGHRGPVNAVAFVPDGSAVVSGGHDATLRRSTLGGGPQRQLDLGTPVNGLVVAGDGQVVAGGADGKLHFVSADMARSGEAAVAETPVVALALSGDGSRIAAGGIRGSVSIVLRQGGTVERTLVGPGLPVWSVAFRPGSAELVTGGGDRLVRRWSVATGEHLGAVVMARPADALARHADDPGAEVFRACIACHTLDPDGGNRAGPTLHGVIGRRIATAPGYDYSPALRGMDIVWTKETIARLFELGPNAYTPGTKMPEQRVTDPGDRQALVDFIARVTGAR
jgi:cytochrome c